MPRQIVLTAVLLTAGLLSGQQANPNRPSLGSSVSSNSIYTNSSYAFTCKVPVGWVLRTDEMNAGNDPGKGQVLLAAFERPPDAAGSAVNSTILIATEPQSAYPGLKNPEDYVAPLTEVVTAKGFKAVNEPYIFPVGNKSLVRADFARESTNGKDHLTAYQSTLVMLSRGSIISFTFIAESEDENERLMGNLSFAGSAKNPAKTVPEKKAK